MAVVPNEGEQWAVLKVHDAAPASNARMNVLVVGTGATVESETVTMASITEVAEARVTGSLSRPSADTDRLDATMTFAGALKTVTQAARTNVTTVGGAGQTMYFYALYAGIPVEAGDSVQYLLDVVYGGA